MVRNYIHIGIIESSEIIRSGVESILMKGLNGITIIPIQDLEDIDLKNTRSPVDLILINPVQILNRQKLFQNLRKENPGIRWLGLVYSFHENELLGLFDDLIHINEPAGEMIQKIKKYSEQNESENTSSLQARLSERELAVLKEVVRGHSNKEISEILHISIHTVISHQKNISQKTGIKSKAGLIVFALTHKIISLDLS